MIPRAEFMTIFVTLSLAGFAFGFYVIAPAVIRAIRRRNGGSS